MKTRTMVTVARQAQTRKGAYIVLEIRRAWDVVMPERIMIFTELEVGDRRH